MLRNGTRVPKSGFAAVKSFAKLSFPCENGIFHALVVRSCESSCEVGATVLRSGTRVPKVVSQLRKFSQRGA